MSCATALSRRTGKRFSTLLLRALSLGAEPRIGLTVRGLSRFEFVFTRIYILTEMFGSIGIMSDATPTFAVRALYHDIEDRGTI